ncbi:MAG: hypothetical protein AAF297_04790 [Planctomycetota bacterium]
MARTSGVPSLPTRRRRQGNAGKDMQSTNGVSAAVPAGSSAFDVPLGARRRR